MDKKLYRDEFHQKIGGVCAGLAEYFETDVTLIRIIFVIAAFVSVGLIAYFVLWIVLPKKGYLFNTFNNPTVDYRVPQPPVDDPNMPPPAGGFQNRPFTNTPFENRPFTNTPFQNNPFGNNPFGSEPVPQMPPQKSHAGVIIGGVLIIIGALVLMDNYDLFPDIDFGQLWPLVLVFIGGALIVSGQVNQTRQKYDWHKTDAGEPANVTPPAADAPAENNSTVE